MTFAQAARPDAKPWGLLYDMALVTGFSLFIALSARIALPLPFSPVPVTGQTLAVLLTGAVLGSRRGGAAVLLYLIEGAAGLPVFAAGGAGFAWLAGPTGGYLVGFLPAAWVAGLLAERGWDRRVLPAVMLMLAGNAAIYLCGLCGLARFVPLDRLLVSGLLPFLPGDAFKIVGAALLLPSGRRLLRC